MAVDFINRIKLINPMPKDPLAAYKSHTYQRSNSIQSHNHQTRVKSKNMDRISTKANTSKRQSSISPPKSRKKPKNASLRKDSKDKSKISACTRKIDSRQGFTMTNSVNIPHLSPASHSEFTRNNSLQFTTHLGDSSTTTFPLSDILQRTKVTLQKYELTTQRLASRNKEMSRKLAIANHQIAMLERQLRRSKEL